MISKNITYGTLDIDIDAGKIWLNCPSCLLRIQGLNFEQTQEKFSMIDINANNVFMYPGESIEKDLDRFLESIILLAGLKTMNMGDQEKKDFLEDWLIKIKEVV